jgi:hypothetical protein
LRGLVEEVEEGARVDNGALLAHGSEVGKSIHGRCADDARKGHGSVHEGFGEQVASDEAGHFRVLWLLEQLSAYFSSD